MTVERWGTVSDVLTAFGAVAIAVVGAVWTWFRYKRENPYLPRINGTIDLNHSTVKGVDYVSWVLRIEHVAGGEVKILQEPVPPTITVVGLVPATKVGWASEQALAIRGVFRQDGEL